MNIEVKIGTKNRDNILCFNTCIILGEMPYDHYLPTLVAKREVKKRICPELGCGIYFPSQRAMRDHKKYAHTVSEELSEDESDDEDVEEEAVLEVENPDAQVFNIGGDGIHFSTDEVDDDYGDCC